MDESKERKKEEGTWLTADLRAIKSYSKGKRRVTRYIFMLDPFRGNYGLIRAFVNQLSNHKRAHV